MSGFATVAFKGVEEFHAATKTMEKNVRKACSSGIRKNQTLLKKNLKSTLSGSPRANQRGKSSVYPEEVKLTTSTSFGRSGPPGKFTGLLQKGVSGSRILPDAQQNTYVGSVFMKGGSRGMFAPNNFKNHIFEARFPYFAPTVQSATNQMAQAFDDGWNNAIHKMGGNL